MILQALNAYYERLAADPDSDVAALGYSRQGISLRIVVNLDGSLDGIKDYRVPADKGKPKSRSFIMPGNATPSGSGINPGFLWGNPAYTLGYKKDDRNPERTQKSFEAFCKRHLEAEAEVGDEHFSAVCRFLESWDPTTAGNHADLIDIATGFCVFQIRGKKELVHERPAVRSWWESQLQEAEENDEDTLSQCLVTGEVGPIARLHEPKIKGVWGGQSAGALLVSFNSDAYESYGKDKKRGGLNAPVSERVAFQYTTALNRLLDRSAGRRMSVGDTTVVFWTDKPSPAEGWIAEIVNPSIKAEDETQVAKTRSLLDAVVQGKFPPELGEPDTPFYVLGLSPNAARISIRFWYVSTLREFIDNLRQHFVDLEIVRGKKDLPHPPLWRLLQETVREAKDIPDLLEGSLLRSILTGQPYPQLFFSSLIRRMRADREVRFTRAAAIKACLNRNTRFGIVPLTQELPMALDPDRPEPAYQLGRLFAELEKTQEDAMPGVNDTIKDRYFSSASATPRSVFPRLIRMSQHHLGKLDKGQKIYHERRIQTIASHFDDFPSHFSMRDQGLFAIGYYHQRQDLFTKKSDTSSSTTTEQE